MERTQAALEYAERAVGPATQHGPGVETELPTEGGRKDNYRAGQSLVDAGIGIMVAVIVLANVAIPVVNDAIANMNVTGTTKDILDYVDLALAVALFVAAISLVR